MFRAAARNIASGSIPGCHKKRRSSIATTACRKDGAMRSSGVSRRVSARELMNRRRVTRHPGEGGNEGNERENEEDEANPGGRRGSPVVYP